MTERVHNFSAGPAALPLACLEAAQRDLLALPGAGASVMEISHRSKTFAEIHAAAKDNIRTLMKVPDNYHILFMQGGATLQFSAIAMNFLRSTGTADYILTGSWGSKAIKEAQKEGEARVVWSGKEDNFVRVPTSEELDLDSSAAYLHFTSNETIQGVEFADEPAAGDVPLICDASSDFLARPIPIERYGLLYAGAQKNVGPSGLAVVIIRDDLLERVPEKLPSLMDYKLMAEKDSLYNTPPTFGIYMVMLTTQWVREEIGGLEKMEARNRQKAAALYDAIDNSDGFYRGHATPESRSIMNVTFRLPTEELEAQFIAEAKASGLDALKGHRSVGGLRASIYNAMETESVHALRDFMAAFKDAHAAEVSV
jgi:phosphoserine aminotransferase